MRAWVKLNLFSAVSRRCSSALICTTLRSSPLPRPRLLRSPLHSHSHSLGPASSLASQPASQLASSPTHLHEWASRRHQPATLNNGPPLSKQTTRSIKLAFVSRLITQRAARLKARTRKLAFQPKARRRAQTACKVTPELRAGRSQSATMHLRPRRI